MQKQQMSTPSNPKRNRKINSNVLRNQTLRGIAKNHYNVSYPTFKKWFTTDEWQHLRSMNNNSTIVTPNQVEFINEIVGNPNAYNE